MSASGTQAIPPLELPGDVRLPPPPSLPPAPDIPAVPQIDAAPVPTAPPVGPAPPVAVPNRQSVPSAPSVPSGGYQPRSVFSGGGGHWTADGTSPAAESQVRARRRERRFRRAVRRLAGCLYALPHFDQRVVRLRAGLGRAHPQPRVRVARRFKVSAARIKTSERRAIRILRASERSQSCTGNWSNGWSRALALLTGGPLARSLLFAVTHAAPGNTSSGSSGAEDGVLGASASGAKRKEVKGAGITPSAVADDQGGASGLLIAGLLAGALLLATGLVAARRRQLAHAPDRWSGWSDPIPPAPWDHATEDPPPRSESD
jgi:hypothetical protein